MDKDTIEENGALIFNGYDWGKCEEGQDEEYFFSEEFNR